MKKRVHELAKQLKEHGVQLSNQEMVEKLRALGYDVKSHSSSLEFEEADAAYRRILLEARPRSPAAAAPGTSPAKSQPERDARVFSTASAREPLPARTTPSSARPSVPASGAATNADHAPSLSAAMTATRDSLGRFLQLRMERAFGDGWEQLLLDEKKQPIRLPMDGRAQAHWDWTALSAGFHALVKTKERAARVDQAQFKLFMSLKNFRDKLEQHPTRSVGPRQYQLAVEDMIELLESIGDIAAADRVRRIPLDL